jgi:hypothetical protein
MSFWLYNYSNVCFFEKKVKLNIIENQTYDLHNIYIIGILGNKNSILCLDKRIFLL